jgi:hypothetical protein
MIHTIESILGRCIEEGECMLWTGAKSAGKHPRPLLSYHGKQNRTCNARPLLFKLLGKKRPKGKPLTMMTCWNSLCLAPAHMVAASKGDVVRGATKAGRYPMSPGREVRRREIARARAKLTMDKARAIRRRYFGGEATMMALAAEYGVHVSMICKVIHNWAWTELAANASAFHQCSVAALVGKAGGSERGNDGELCRESVAGDLELRRVRRGPSG